MNNLFCILLVFSILLSSCDRSRDSAKPTSSHLPRISLGINIKEAIETLGEPAFARQASPDTTECAFIFQDPISDMRISGYKLTFKNDILVNIDAILGQ